MKPVRLLILFIAIGILFGVTLWRFRPQGIPNSSDDVPLKQGSMAQLARQAQEALTLTENLEPAKATALWEAVRAGRPDDVGLSQNIAANHLLEYSLTVSRLSEKDLPEDQVRSLRQTLPTMFNTINEAIGTLNRLDPQGTAAVWMSAELRQQQAKLLPEVIANSVRREIAESVLNAIDQRPIAELMGIMVEITEVAHLDNLAPRIAAATAKLSDAEPRNIVLAAEGASRNIDQKSALSTELIRRLATLCEPIAEEIQQLGQPVDQLAGKILKAIADNEWDSAGNQLAGWFNVLRITAAFRTDYRKLNPHILDFLLTAPVYQIMATVDADNTNPPVGKTSFAKPITARLAAAGNQVSMEKFSRVLPVDVDIDDRPELVTLAKNKLQVWKLAGDAIDLYAEATIKDGASLLMWADLFVVDSGSPDRQKASRAGLSADEQKRLAKAHDTYPNLIVAGDLGIEVFRVAATGNSPDERLLLPARATGLDSIRGVTAMSRGDVDADGDLDLILGTKTGVEFWINRGNMTFYPVAGHSQLPPVDSPIVSLAMSDVDRDLDIDFATIAADGTVGWLENILHQQVRWHPLESLKVSVGGGVEFAELDGDVSWDVVACGPDETKQVATYTPDTGLWNVVRTDSLPRGGRGLRLADFNYDTWTDLVLWDDSGARIHPGRPGGVFDTEAIQISAAAVQHVDFADLDGDRLLDLILITTDGELQVVGNTTSNAGHSLAVRYLGIDDNATGRVNHYAIGALLEVWFGSKYRSSLITDRTTYFGLGDNTAPTTMRAVLTNGITQHVPNPPVDLVIDEKQELKGSCPYLYGWDGEQFAFVTDCLWAAPLGLQSSRGKVLPDRSWEYLLVPGAVVANRDGEYELRITEELWEIGYFDQIELTAVDHPAGTSVYTNEKVGPPQIAEHKLHSFDNLQPPRVCKDRLNNDCSDLLAAIDRRYVQGFDFRLRQGLTQPHWIELDVGPIVTEDRVVLVLTGWILPTDTSLNIANDQNPDLPAVELPSVWVPDGDSWREAIPFMGFPGGKTKTIVVDVSDVVSAADPRLQIRTSAQIYWDRAAVAINPSVVPVKTQPVTMTSAELTWHGFSEMVPRNSDEPHTYKYDQTFTQNKWPPIIGNLTRYGDVKSLVSEWDDSLVVMGPGDEIRLRFQVPESPPPDGWMRDFVLHNVGWDKDADLNTLTGQSVAPVPTRNMQMYPFAESRNEELASEQRNLLDRKQPFRSFWRR